MRQTLSRSERGLEQWPLIRSGHAVVLLGIVVGGAALRFATLHVQSFWLDETVTVHLLHLPFGKMLTTIPSSESTPPLYYVLAWPWAHVFGFTEVGVRSLSALAGVATIPVCYAIGAAAASPRVGLMAAGLYALNPMTFYYGQEARAYVLLVLFSALSLLFFIRSTEQPSSRTLWAWAGTSALALCSHYFAGFLVVPELVWLVWKRRTASRTVVPAALAVALTAVALAPLALAQHSAVSRGWISSTPLLEWVAQVPKQFLVGLDGPVEAVTGGIALVLVGIAVVLVVRIGDERERDAARLGAVLAAAAVALPLVLSIGGVGIFNGRNVIVAWVPAALVVAAGLGTRRGSVAGLGAAAALATLWLGVIAVVVTDKRYQRDDWRGALHAAQTGPGTRAIVLPEPHTPDPVATYLPRARPMPAGGANVNEIDLVELAPHHSGQPLVAPQLPSAPPPTGFTVWIERRAATYTVVRYRAARRLFVAPARLAHHLTGHEAAVYVLAG